MYGETYLYLYINVTKYWSYEQDSNLFDHVKYKRNVLGPVIIGEDGLPDFKSADELANKVGAFLSDDGTWGIL